MPITSITFTQKSLAGTGWTTAFVPPNDPPIIFAKLYGSTDNFVLVNDFLWTFGGTNGSEGSDAHDADAFLVTVSNPAAPSASPLIVTQNGTTTYTGTNTTEWTTKEIVLDIDRTASLYTEFKLILSFNNFGNPATTTTGKSIDMTGGIVGTFNISGQGNLYEQTFAAVAPCFSVDTRIPEKNILGEYCRVVKFVSGGKNLYKIPKDTFGQDIPDKEFKITEGHPFILNEAEGEVTVETLLDKYPVIQKIESEQYLCTVITDTRTTCKIHNMDVITWCNEEFEEYKAKNNLVVFANL